MGRLIADGSAPHEYHLTSQWLVEGTTEQVAAAMASGESPVRWWGAAFLRAEVLRAGGDHGQGTLVRFLTRGWMPHTFQFVLHLKEVRRHKGFMADVRGDFFGVMGCTLIPRTGGTTFVNREWKVSVAQPYVKWLSPWFRRIFALNHRWVMRCGEQGLQEHVQRRGCDDANHRRPCRGPTFPHNLGWWVDRIAWHPWTESWERALHRS